MILRRDQWLEIEHEHQDRVQEKALAFQQRRAIRQSHPVDDFLFTYYFTSPTKLMGWWPEVGVEIEVIQEDWVQRQYWADLLEINDHGHAVLQKKLWKNYFLERAKWVKNLCHLVSQRPPQFRCYGMHEWAMVYKSAAEDVRHQGQRLRLSPADIARFVESQPIVCSHYDAFRFFTDEAVPLNRLQPALEDRLNMEQSGCLHTNMDLYKWAGKLMPWCGATLLGQCFELSQMAREVDMRASPYDLSEMGYIPIQLETLAGREEYEKLQREITLRSQPLREKLRLLAEVMIHTFEMTTQH